MASVSHLPRPGQRTYTTKTLCGNWVEERSTVPEKRSRSYEVITKESSMLGSDGKHNYTTTYGTMVEAVDKSKAPPQMDCWDLHDTREFLYATDHKPFATSYNATHNHPDEMSTNQTADFLPAFSNPFERRLKQDPEGYQNYIDRWTKSSGPKTMERLRTTTAGTAFINFNKAIDG